MENIKQDDMGDEIKEKYFKAELLEEDPSVETVPFEDEGDASEIELANGKSPTLHISIIRGISNKDAHTISDICARTSVKSAVSSSIQTDIERHFGGKWTVMVVPSNGFYSFSWYKYNQVKIDYNGYHYYVGKVC